MASFVLQQVAVLFVAKRQTLSMEKGGGRGRVAAPLVPAVSAAAVEGTAYFAEPTAISPTQKTDHRRLFLEKLPVWRLCVLLLGGLLCRVSIVCFGDYVSL